MTQRKIRVLVVDDSIVARRLVSDVLNGDPAIEVVGSAANGRIALAKVRELNPDLVTLDVEMPELDGLDTLETIRKQHPRLPVIMFSSLTQRGARATLEALAMGASDYVTKPSNLGSVALALQRVREDLIPKVKSLCNWTEPSPQAQPRTTRSTLPKRVPERVPHAGCSRIEIVAIGSSTGGPNALAELFQSLPADFPVPIVIAQHMPPIFTRLLAERLSSRSALHFEEGKSGRVLRPGSVWIAPGDHHMTLRSTSRGVELSLNQDHPENSCRPSVDVLFRSVAEIYGSRALSVILTGMGQDGLRGCEAIHAAGGSILAQDQSTSVVWGMPGFVARAGLADKILPLQQIGPEILARMHYTQIVPLSPVRGTR